MNSVIAGPTHTGGVEDFVYQLVDRDLPWDEAQREFMREHRPQSLLQRLIEPEEIANLVIYLSSPLASATTGGACASTAGTSTRSCPDRQETDFRDAAGYDRPDAETLRRGRENPWLSFCGSWPSFSWSAASSQLFRGQILFGIVLIVVGLLVGPGGVSLFT